MTSINLEPPKIARELVANSGFLLARLGHGFKASALDRIEQEGFDPHHYSVLAILAEGDRENQGTIAEALGLDPSRLVNVLDSLEERALIARHRDPLDRRRHVVRITPEGIGVLNRLRALAEGLADAFLSPLTPEDRKTFHRLLLQLARVHDPSCFVDD
ncbi:MAG TPA: MarR family transcriptional regulator [Gaiellaceae bacterium]|jgi:DNA-binding MarR family transcriptional regulator